VTPAGELGAGELGRVGLWAGGADALPAAALQQLGRAVEAAGLPTVWVAEGLGRDSLLTSAILLSATERLHVGTAVSVTWSRAPVMMVGGQQALSEWFPGRFTLGIGVSHGPMNAMRGLDYASPYRHLTEYLDGMDAVTYASVAAPATRTLLGAQGPKMLALAAERLDGVLPYLTTPEHTAQARTILGPDAVLAPEQGIVFATDPAEARAVARANLAIYVEQLPNYRNSWLRLGFDASDLDDGGSDRLIDALVAWGGDDAAAARIRAHLDAGADHVVVQVLSADRGLSADAIGRVAAIAASL